MQKTKCNRAFKQDNSLHECTGGAYCDGNCKPAPPEPNTPPPRNYLVREGNEADMSRRVEP